MIKAIIFDYAGVISKNGYWLWLRQTIPDINQKEDLFQKISEEVDSAKISHEEFMDILSKASGKTPQQVWAEVKEKFVINPYLLKVIKQLKKKYKMGLLTNFTYPWFKYLLEENDLPVYFDQILISSLHKVIKPNPKAFTKMLTMLKVKADEALFIDDTYINIEAAAKVGLQGILYTTDEELIQYLNKLGVKQ